MKKWQRLAVGSALLVSLSAPSFSLFANEDIADAENGIEYYQEIGERSFSYISGIVEEITDVPDGEVAGLYDQQNIRISGEHGTAILQTSHLTYVLGEPVAVGDEIRGYFDGGMPMAMIYPPQHKVRLIVNGEFEQNVHIDRFARDERGLVSADGRLAINIAEDTEIILQDGQDFRAAHEGLEIIGAAWEQEIDGRLLVAVYDISTRSIPAIANPSRVIVLFEQAIHLPGDIGGLDLGIDLAQVEPYELTFENHGISVGGQILESHTWQQIDDAYYVPLRAIVDALGFADTIIWNQEQLAVTLGNGGADEIHIAIGSNSFVVGENIIELQAPAILIDSHTFVPFQFFSQVFGLNNAYLHAGQVFINNDEIMN